MPSTPRLNLDYERRPYWHATMPALPDRAGKDLPDAVDAVVIGGGYTGLAAARALASAGAKVAVLEARTLGWGASTRNGGIAHPGYKWGPATMVKRYGRDLATRLYAESVEATAFLGRTIRENDIEADLRLNGYMELAWSKRDADEFPDEVDIRTEWGSPARNVPRDRLAEEVGTSAYHGGLAIDSGGVLHPGKWFAGLVGLAERAGADLYEGVRATAIRRQRDGRYVVETDRGAIQARDVLVATNAYTDGAAPSLRRRIIPIGSYIIATEPLPEDLAREISPTGRAYFDTKNFLAYWHVSADRRLIWGGRVSFLPTTVDRTAKLLHRRMLDVHPQVAGYRVEYSWGGKIGMTFDRMPHIGRRNGVMYAMGCCGSGVVLLHWLGTKAGEWLAGGEAPALAKLRFPLVPAPYEGRPWFLPMVGEFYRAKDRLARGRSGPEPLEAVERA
ncbi:MAG TPA: FAD-binding oxidoreductase [Candidatus Limnocylindrales bacterium]|nr:FAD-binding oxidoreductase [Candidatus Limnocylindrales bacterium]